MHRLAWSSIILCTGLILLGSVLCQTASKDDFDGEFTNHLASNPARYKSSHPSVIAGRSVAASHSLSELSFGAPRQQITANLQDAYGRLPLSFEANYGQTDNRVQFLHRGSGFTLFLSGSEAVLRLRNTQASRLRLEQAAGLSKHTLATAGPSSRPHDNRTLNEAAQESVLRIRLLGADAHTRAVGLDELPGKSNYFIGNDPKKWRSDVPAYARVKYQQIYPGVDLVYHGNQQQLESDFIVAPGAEPASIKFEIEGASGLSIDDDGNLVIAEDHGHVELKRATAYQEVNGRRTKVEAQYRRVGRHEVVFSLGTYDRALPLVIDPFLIYSSYLGGSQFDAASGIAVDSSGAAYVTGVTASIDFPTTSGAVNTFLASNDGADAFVTKFNTTGTALVYSTYLGGFVGSNQGNAIGIDASGNAWVAGFTESDSFPVTPGALRGGVGFANCGPCGFVSKLNPSGSALLYSTYLTGITTAAGSLASNTVNGMVLDTFGNAYMVGTTNAADFPTTPRAFQPNINPGRPSSVTNEPNRNSGDAFVTKLNSTGALVYSTFLGGDGPDTGTAIAVDSSGAAYVTGSTESFTYPGSLFPANPLSAQPIMGGGFVLTPDYGPNCTHCLINPPDDAFVAKLDPSGSGLVYSTYLGGASFESGEGISVDSAGNAYVTGTTDSTDFPSSGPNLDGFGFIARLNAAGTAFSYSSYLGGIGRGIAVDSFRNVFITGLTQSPKFPVTSGNFQVSSATGFFTAFNAAGCSLNLAYATRWGANSTGGVNILGSVALDNNGNAYIAGDTGPGQILTTPGAFQATPVPSLSGTTGFISKIGGLAFSGPPDFCLTGSTVIVNPGATASVPVQVDSTNGFNSTVNLSLSTPPDGVSVSLAPPAVTTPAFGSATSALTVSVDPSVPPSMFTLTITGVSGALVHQTSVTVKITDFSLTAPAVFLSPGQSAATTVQVNSLGGFEAPVSLTVSTPPAGVFPFLSTGSLIPPASGSASATLTVNAAFNAAPSLFTLIVTGTSGSLQHQTRVPVTISAPSGGGGSGGGGGNNGGGGGSSGSCSCSKSGNYVNPQEPSDPVSVLTSNVTTGGLSSSPSGKYTVDATDPTTLYVKKSGQNVLTLGRPGPDSWGFSPDDDRFMYAALTGIDISQPVDNVQVFDLQSSTPNRAIVTTGGTLAGSRREFSPSGKYFFYARLSGAQHTDLEFYQVQGVTQQTLVTTQSFDFAVGSGEDDFGEVQWGFSPDSPESAFVFAFIDAHAANPNTYEWNLISLPSGHLNQEVISQSASFWQFNPCGDIIALVTQSSQTLIQIGLFSTANGAALSNQASIIDSLSPLFFADGSLQKVQYTDPSGQHTQVMTSDPSCAPNTPASSSPETVSLSNNAVQITFLNGVSTAGVTTLTPLGANCPDAPHEFKFGTPPVCYDIQTSARFSGMVQVCITDPSVSSSSVLMHFVSSWRSLTSTVTNHTVCGSDSSLSPFAMAEPADDTPPTTTPLVSPQPNAAGWNNQNVNISLSAMDNPGGSGVQSITYSLSINGGQAQATTLNAASAQFAVSQEGTTVVTFFAIDNSGNLESAHTLTIRLDKTPPTIMGTRTPGANAYGWNNSDVTVHFTCSDSLSGVLPGSTTGDTTVSSEGLNQSVSGSCQDVAGNTASTTVSGINIDKTPPSISGARSPAANSFGWNNTDVTVSFSCSDSLSGLAQGSPPANTVLSAEGANQSVAGVCNDLAGNVATARVVGINIDKTPPALNCGATPNVLWPPNHKLVNVSTTVNVTDSLSGPAEFELLSITSNEPPDADPDIVGWTLGAPSTSGQLRAERFGAGNGRVYTLNYKALDKAGNSSVCAPVVSVPHDQGSGE